MGEIRQIWNKAGIPWQAAEMGKVDEGGGGTVAVYLAKYNMEIVDAGCSLIGMHSPMEVASKIDVWNTYRAYRAFYNG